jgi:hypothetical protein
MFPEVTRPTDDLQRTLAELIKHHEEIMKDHEKVMKDHEQIAKRLDQLSVVVDSMAKMHEQMMNWLSVLLAATLLLAMAVEYAAAHERRHVKIGDREVEFIVGWYIEPTYAGVPNKVSLRVLALVEEHEHEHDEHEHENEHDEHEHEHEHDEHGHEHGHDEHGHEHGHAGESRKVRKVPVLGLEKYLKVEVSTGGKSIILNLRPVWGDPGHYVADIVPTVPGVYVFRFFGNVDGTEVNEVFDCSKGHFNCVEPLSKIMFPEVTQPTDDLQRTLAEIRKDHERVMKDHEQIAKRLDQLSVVVDSMAKMHEQMMNTDTRLESSINSVSAIAYGGLGAGIIGLIVAVMSLIRRPR